MIQPLRNIHRRSFYVMAVVLPIVFLAGLAGREPQLPASTYAVAESGWDVWPRHLVAGTLVQNAGSTRVRLRLLAPLGEPDPLLYFSPSNVSEKDLPPDAVLLGRLVDGTEFSLPGRQGTLVLYSLGHRRVIDCFPVKAVP